MAKYILNRIVQTIISLFLVSVLAFFLVSMMPKDPVYSLLGTEIDEQEYEAAYHRLNLDKPIIYRYVLWAKGVLSGDWGTSYKYHLPVSEVIGQKIAITMYLSVVSTLISFPLGILFGVITAVKRGKWQDTTLTLLANVTNSIPAYVLAMVLLYVFCMKYKLLPTSGFTFPWEDLGKHLRQIIMPMFCLSLGGIAGICRQTRSSMLEAIRQDYVRTARSKGLMENFITRKHVLRNGLIPIITLIGSRLAHIIGGSMFVENVFAIPGMGSLMVQSVQVQDIPVMQACVLLSATVLSVAYLVTDMLYVLVDPRISLS